MIEPSALPMPFPNRLLKPLLPRLIGTRATPEIHERRSYLALDWLIREATPAWLDLVPALAPHAAALRDAAVIADAAAAPHSVVRSASSCRPTTRLHV